MLAAVGVLVPATVVFARAPGPRQLEEGAALDAPDAGGRALGAPGADQDRPHPLLVAEEAQKAVVALRMLRVPAAHARRLLEVVPVDRERLRAAGRREPAQDLREPLQVGSRGGWNGVAQVARDRQHHQAAAAGDLPRHVGLELARALPVEALPGASGVLPAAGVQEPVVEQHVAVAAVQEARAAQDRGQSVGVPDPLGHPEDLDLGGIPAHVPAEERQLVVDLPQVQPVLEEGHHVLAEGTADHLEQPGAVEILDEGEALRAVPGDGLDQRPA